MINKYEPMDPRQPPTKAGLIMVLLIGAAVVVCAYLFWTWLGKLVAP